MLFNWLFNIFRDSDQPNLDSSSKADYAKFMDDFSKSQDEEQCAVLTQEMILKQFNESISSIEHNNENDDLNSCNINGDKEIDL